MVLKKCEQNWEKYVCPKIGLKHVYVLHDNAPAYKSSTAAQLLKSEKVNELSHRPYSPDLVQSDFSYLKIIKKKQSGKRYITKTCLYNFNPLKAQFYIVKLGFTGVYIIFHISAQNIDCGYSLEPPRRGGSTEYPQSMFWAEIWKILEFFIWKLSFFWW